MKLSERAAEMKKQHGDSRPPEAEALLERLVGSGRKTLVIPFGPPQQGEVKLKPTESNPPPATDYQI